MPFFTTKTSVGIGEVAVILNLPPGVKLRALHITAESPAGTVGSHVWVSAHPSETLAYEGVPLGQAAHYDGLTDKVDSHNAFLSFSAAELSCLDREEKKLYAAAGANAMTVYCFGVIER
jgi:hypothetical protein